MRQIGVETIIAAVKDAAIKANYELEEDMLAAFAQGEQEEESPAGREIFRQLLENARIAAEERIPLCQDCGLAVIFVELGQEVRIVGGDFEAG
jgi:fumarate hydratase subunit alpha